MPVLVPLDATLECSLLVSIILVTLITFTKYTYDVLYDLREGLE